MQNHRQPPESAQTAASAETPKEAVSLPALPSFDLADNENNVDIEIQADQLLNYINKLTALADRACSTAIHQSESAQRMDANRQSEITFLRQQLAHANTQFREQQQAMARLEQSSREQIAALETELRQKEVYSIQREKEFIRLRSDHDSLATRQFHTADSAQIDDLRVQHQIEPLKHEIDELKLQLANRDEAIQTKNQEFKAMELNYRGKIVELEQRLRDSQAELQMQEAKLKEKEALIQASATKETEIGNLIKRLSSECETLNGELQQKSQVLARIKSKKDQPANDGKIWRRVIGRLQEEV
jgi:chromosome segregation ATPase